MSKSLKRGLLSSCVTILALSIATAAAAAPVKAEKEPAKAAAKVKAKRANTSDLHGQLSTGKLEVPTRATLPKSIPATETDPGFHIEVPGGYNRHEEVTYAQVWASKEDATRQMRGEDPGPSGCLQTAYPNMGQELNWSGSMSSQTTVQNYKNERYGGGYNTSVQMVRADRIVRSEGDTLDYEVKFAFVDAETHGVRLHTSQLLTFKKVGELPGNVKIYGAKSDDEVTFLVRREKHEKERFFFGSLMGTVNGQHMGSSSENCPVVFSMEAKKGVADAAVIQLDAVLEINDVESDAGFLAQMPARHVPSESDRQREAKVRSMRIGFSSTWLSEDTRPIVSFGHGWLGKERVQPI